MDVMMLNCSKKKIFQIGELFVLTYIFISKFT